MRMKLTKLVYAYDMYADRVRAVHVYSPCEDDELGQILVDRDDCKWVKQERTYNGREWEDLLYQIKESKADVKVVRAIDEITP